MLIHFNYCSCQTSCIQKNDKAFVNNINLDNVDVIFQGHKGEDTQDVENLWHVEDDGGQENGQKIGDQDPNKFVAST